MGFYPEGKVPERPVAACLGLAFRCKSMINLERSTRAFSHTKRTERRSDPKRQREEEEGDVRPRLKDSRAYADRASSSVGVLSRPEGASALVRVPVTRADGNAGAILLSENPRHNNPTCRTTERVCSPRPRAPRTRRRRHPCRHSCVMPHLETTKRWFWMTSCARAGR